MPVHASVQSAWPHDASHTSDKSIGAVLELLRDEFPDVTISKLRFLEERGLVTPQRTQSGYRSFSDADVERLRYILTAQRDTYLPLKVIKERLAELDSGHSVEPTVRRGQPTPDVVGDPRRIRLTVEELAATTDVEPAYVVALRDAGLLMESADGVFDGTCLAVIKTVVALGEVGLEPRHLRSLVTSADRQAAMVEQLVSPTLRHRAPGARAQAESMAREVGQLLVDLQSALTRSRISRIR